jgi:hypothetical protein
MNYRKQVFSRASLLVYLSLALSLAGRYAFDRSYWRHSLIGMASLVLTAAMVMLFFDMRENRADCVAAR